jgi:hypothetical protein
MYFASYTATSMLQSSPGSASWDNNAHIGPWMPDASTPGTFEYRDTTTPHLDLLSVWPPGSVSLIEVGAQITWDAGNASFNSGFQISDPGIVTASAVGYDPFSASEYFHPIGFSPNYSTSSSDTDDWTGSFEAFGVYDTNLEGSPYPGSNVFIILNGSWSGGHGAPNNFEAWCRITSFVNPA